MSSCAECTADAPAPAATPHAPAAGVAGSEAAHPRATLAPTNEDWQYGVGRAGAVARLLRLRLKLGRRRPADASRHGEALCGDEGMLVASSASDTECLDEVGITAPTLLSCLAGQGAGVHETGRSNSITYNAEDKDACCQCIYWICDMC